MVEKKRDAIMRKVLERVILSFISPKTAMLDVDGLLDFLIEFNKESKEPNENNN